MEDIKNKILSEIKSSGTISGWDISKDNLPDHVNRALRIANDTATKEEIIYHCLEMMLAYTNSHELYSEEELKEYSEQILKSI